MPGRTHAHVKFDTAGNKTVANESQNRQVGTFPVGDLGNPELNSPAEKEGV